jgi:Protein of unknown function (DUF998)
VTTSRRRLTVVALLWISAALIYVAFEALAAATVPRYSYAEHYISVLGVPDFSPRAYLMNTAFYAQAALFFAGAVIAVRGIRGRWTGGLFLLLTAANAVGNVLVGVVYGGSPLWVDGHKWLHMLGAILAIFGGNAAAIVGTFVIGRAVTARWYRPVGVLIGVAGLVIFAILQNYNYWAIDYAPIGVVERACVYTIMLWQIVTGVVLLIRPKRAAAQSIG